MSAIAEAFAPQIADSPKSEYVYFLGYGHPSITSRYAVFKNDTASLEMVGAEWELMDPVFDHVRIPGSLLPRFKFIGKSK